MTFNELKFKINDISKQHEIEEQEVITKIGDYLNHHYPQNNSVQIQAYTKEKFLPYAKHEAGHWVVADILGFKPKEITFNIINSYYSHKGSSSLNLDFSSLSAEDIIDYCEKRIQVLFSGALAQTLKNGKVDDSLIDSICNSNASGDKEKAKELIRIVRSFKYPAANTNEEIVASLNNIKIELMKKTKLLVESNNTSIEKIGREIINGIDGYNKSFELSEDRIKSIIQICNSNN